MHGRTPAFAAGLLILVGGALLFGQVGSRRAQPGAPLAGITAQEFELFRLGLEDFTEVETPEDGLGPAFNGTSCAVCHSSPAIGGISPVTEIRGGYRDAEGKFTELYGGTLYHLFSIPNHRCQVQIPPEVNVMARRAPIPLFGAGLVEAVPDEAILGLEDPEDRNGDGIRGRAARVIDVGTGRERIGRFGWKAQHATLLAFSADAYRNEMGITNDLFPDEMALGIDPEQLKRCSPPSKGVEDVRDRRTGMRGIDKFEAFMKFLAPIERGPIDHSVLEGEILFQATGCGSCHSPSLRTGANANPLFDRKTIALYSDLLLHDVGTGDGIEQAAAAASEIRTPALWGLGLRRPYLHDGSAATIEESILRHQGESYGVTERFRALAPEDKRRLLAFLNSL